LKSEAFLERVLAFLVTDETFCQKYLNLLSKELFESFPILDRIYAALKQYYDKYKVHPPLLDFAQVVTQDPIDGYLAVDEEESDDIVDLLMDFADVPLTARPRVEERLESELMRLGTVKAIREGLTLTQADDFSADEIREIITSLEGAERISFKKNLGSSIAYDLEERWQRRIEERKNKLRIPTFFLDFDGTMRGGVPEKSLCVMLGRQSTGKTTSLIHLAKVAFLCGHPVLYVTLELSKEMVEDRFDACLTDTKTNYLLKYKDQVNEARSRWSSKNGEDIIVVEGEARKFNVATLQYTLDNLARTKKYYPKLICVDYADLMLSDRRYDQRRFELEDIYMALRALAVKGKYILWTASQANRSGAKEDYLRLEHMAESDSKASNADLVVTINLNEEQKARHEAFLFCAKSRFGPDSEKIGVIVQDLEKTNFIITSPSMVNQPVIKPRKLIV
jgi:replicative DNA helicase